MADYFPSSSNSGESATNVSLRDEPQLLPSNMMMYMTYPSPFEETPNIGISTHQENEAMLVNPTGEQSSLQGQGLSLSLATEIPSGFQMPAAEYRVLPPGFSVLDHGPQEKESMLQFRNLEEVPSSSTSKVVPSSKYLMATQQLLDEVVNVKQALKRANGNKGGEDDNALSPAEGESSGKDANELSPVERQSWQSKLTQLLTMLEKIDRKYKQYYHEMQIVVSSFDTVAGSGAATTYTAVALQTISRHFRSLRDAISSQINATRRSLGESDASSSEKGVGISRLRFVDQQLKERKALHHLGVMQHHTWRPQRGLPDSSVSVLRSWLFEHFLHPYPKDSEKIMLARQTGLTRSQVSNWFINARVRLWKPMVEEMYKEEIDFGDMETDPNPTPGNGTYGSPNSNNKANSSPSSKSGDVQDIEMTGPTSLGFHNDILRGYEGFGNAGLHRSFGPDGVSLTLGLEGVRHHQFATMTGGEMFGSSASPMAPDSMDLASISGANQVQGFLPFASSSHKLQ